MMLEAAPTPCSRTGFHMIKSSLWLLEVLLAPAVVQATADVTPPVDVVQVGSTMMRSPGAAASMAAWIDADAATWVGVLPRTVTVTASTDCLPLPAVMTSSPQRVDWPAGGLPGPPY